MESRVYRAVKDDLNHLSLFLQGIQRSILRIESIDLHGGGGGGGSLRPYSSRVQMLALSKILLIKLPHGFFNPSVRNPRARASFDRYFLIDWIVRFLFFSNARSCGEDRLIWTSAKDKNIFEFDYQVSMKILLCQRFLLRTPSVYLARARMKFINGTATVTKMYHFISWHLQV